jgi:4a-hydroxytetrahydrobiopterin dehydratase
VPKLLTADKIKKRLEKMPGWEYKDGFLVKELTFNDFMDAIKFINQLSKIAEYYGHHPDIYIRYNKVRLMLQTHSEMGVTIWDFQLASRIEKFLRSKVQKKK